MAGRRGFLLGALAIAAAPRAWCAPDGDDEVERQLHRLRAGGFVLLMRHAATEPGNGDPPGMRLGDCATQRNLSEAGRGAARRIGERLKRARVPIARVYTSPWCRCRETALLAFGQAEDWDALSSSFEIPDRDAEMAERVRKRIAGYLRKPPGGNVVMVTHNTNIASLARLSIAPGAMALMRPDGCCSARPSGQLAL